MIEEKDLIDFLVWFRQQPFEYSEFNTNRDMVRKYLKSIKVKEINCTDADNGKLNDFPVP